MFREFIILISFVTVFSQIGSRTECRHDNECGAGECCYDHEGPLIVSKRESVLPIVGKFHQGGWCEQYKLQGERCNPFNKLNGHCGCGPGLTCKRFPFTTTSSIIKKSLLAGDYLCAPVS